MNFVHQLSPNPRIQNDNCQQEKYQHNSPLQINNQIESLDDYINLQSQWVDDDRPDIMASTIQNYLNLSDIQKSLEILGKVLPQIFTKETIDHLYGIIIRKNTQKSNSPNKLLFQQNDANCLNKDQHKQIKGSKYQITSQVNNKYSLFKSNNFSLEMRKQNEISFTKKKKYNLVNSIPKYSINSTLKTSSQHQQIKNMIFNKKHKEEEIEYQKIENYKKQCKNFNKSNKKSKSTNQMKQLQKIWNPQMQELLISLYQKGQKFASIGNELRQKFPQYKASFTFLTIRCKLKKLVRASIRLLQQNLLELSNHNLPKLVRLGDDMIEKIMYHREAISLRFLLLQIYISKHCNIYLLQKAIIEINQFVRYYYTKQPQ